MLVHVKVEHHVHAIVVTEELLVLGWQNVRFAQQNRIPFAPLKEISEIGEIFVMTMSLARTLAFNDERHGVYAKAGHSELQPISHDALDLRPDREVLHVEIGLKFVEAVEVPLSCDSIECPRGCLETREDHSSAVVLRPSLRPCIPVLIS